MFPNHIFLCTQKNFSTTFFVLQFLSQHTLRDSVSPIFRIFCQQIIFGQPKYFVILICSSDFFSHDSYHFNVHVTNSVFQKTCVTKYFYKLFWVTTFTMCTVTIAAKITSDLVRGPSFTSGWSDYTACSHSYWNKTGWGSVGMFQVIKTGWPQHGQKTISSNALLYVSWISRAMDWGPHKWVWEKAPVSQLKLSKFRQDLNPHLNVIFSPLGAIVHATFLTKIGWGPLWCHFKKKSSHISIPKLFY